MSKLLRHLKRMEYYQSTIYHDIEQFSTPSNQSDSCGIERSVSLQNPEPPAPDSAELPSEIVELKKGKCLIINEVRFPPSVI